MKFSPAYQTALNATHHGALAALALLEGRPADARLCLQEVVGLGQQAIALLDEDARTWEKGHSVRATDQEDER